MTYVMRPWFCPSSIPYRTGYDCSALSRQTCLYNTTLSSGVRTIQRSCVPNFTHARITQQHDFSLSSLPAICTIVFFNYVSLVYLISVPFTILYRWLAYPAPVSHSIHLFSSHHILQYMSYHRKCFIRFKIDGHFAYIVLLPVVEHFK